jgi:hypothetical protein
MTLPNLRSQRVCEIELCPGAELAEPYRLVTHGIRFSRAKRPARSLAIVP